MERRRPTSLTALTVIAVVLGGLITLSGVAQVLGLAFQTQISELSQLPMGQPGVPEALVESQREAQRAVLEVQRAWNPFSWAVAPLAILFGLGLIVAGVRALKLTPGAHRPLAILCAVGVLFDLLRETGAIILSTQVSEAMRGPMTPSVPGGDPRVESLMSGAMSLSMAISVAFAGAWVLLKVGYYLWGLIALTRRETRALYEGSPGPDRSGRHGERS